MKKRLKVSLVTAGFFGVLGATGSLANGQRGWDFASSGSGNHGAMDERLVEARASLDRGRARKAQIEDELRTLGPKRLEIRDAMTKHGRALYRVSRGGMLPIAGGFEALLGHASRVSRLERLVAGEVTALNDLETRGVALRKEQLELDARISAADREVRALEQARVGLAREMAAEQMFDAAFSGAALRPAEDDGRVGYGLSVVGGIATEKFTDQRGRLALPVSGPNMIRDASRSESDGPGLEMVGPSGSAIRAAAAGRVAFAERHGSYGQLVIVDHGDRYYTVYGGFATLEARVGDDVSKSARLGTMGSDPVYFEVRRGTRTQDARVWLGL